MLEVQCDLIDFKGFLVAFIPDSYLGNCWIPNCPSLFTFTLVKNKPYPPPPPHTPIDLLHVSTSNNFSLMFLCVKYLWFLLSTTTERVTVGIDGEGGGLYFPMCVCMCFPLVFGWGLKLANQNDLGYSHTTPYCNKWKSYIFCLFLGYTPNDQFFSYSVFSFIYYFLWRKTNQFFLQNSYDPSK